MYAIIKDGGHQYRVEQGQVIRVQRREVEAGSTLTFGEVLLLGDGSSVKVGAPNLSGASVEGKVVGEAKGAKIVGMHFRRRTRYRRKFGHRQKYTVVRIEKIRG